MSNKVNALAATTKAEPVTVNTDILDRLAALVTAQGANKYDLGELLTTKCADVSDTELVAQLAARHPSLSGLSKGNLSKCRTVYTHYAKQLGWTREQCETGFGSQFDNLYTLASKGVSVPDSSKARGKVKSVTLLGYIASGDVAKIRNFLPKAGKTSGGELSQDTRQLLNEMKKSMDLKTWDEVILELATNWNDAQPTAPAPVETPAKAEPKPSKPARKRVTKPQVASA